MTDQPLVPTTNELLAAIHDLLVIIHIDSQRNYDLLYAIATNQSEEAIDGLVSIHRQGGIFAPDPFLQYEEEDVTPETYETYVEGQDAPLSNDYVIDLAADYDFDVETDKDPDS